MALRFAPSPTGYLHIGNARTAVINWIMARKLNKSFILRLDDSDRDRSTDAFVEAVHEDLSWLGLSWEHSFAQSERLSLYKEALLRLRNEGHVYACYETDEELALKRVTQRSAGRPPVYDRAATQLTQNQISDLESEGRKPYWRFRLPDEEFCWDDQVQGTVRFDSKSFSDPVLVRADGRPLYTLASVVDDIDTDVSLIVRGSDHISNSGAQIALFKAMGVEPPEFAHHALLTGPKGEPLAKRLGSLSLRELRASGAEPQALLSYLAMVGSSEEVNLLPNLEGLTSAFDLSNLSRSNAVFEQNLLSSLTSQYLHSLPFEAARPRFECSELKQATPEFWLAVRENLNVFEDVITWWKVVTGPIEPRIDEEDFIAQASSCIPKGNFNNETWKDWTTVLGERTNRKGRSLFMPLRLAITGIDHGPAMAKLLPLIGRDRVKGRLMGKAV